ncbi:hypothetical protein [Paenibacillus thalictri]|uniref:Uncharacterized protein n=1 Tax=Paenibacillus thalictri TaxID=2527873 RepID=A0A4Q9DSE1_9BACL|nr:hypothetical protein [Paenibacillus thalictri]TBL77795.1 hypothetical protein EYB31_16780 [Paenibacillus thalictri]
MKAKAILPALAIILLLCSCGKNIPTITADQLKSKHAVLMVTSAELSDSGKAAVQKALANWRQTQNISYEWVSGASELNDDIVGNIESVPYDYVLLVGSSLSQQALTVSAQYPDKKWMLFDDDMARQPAAASNANVMYKRTDPNLLQNDWNDWVQTQLQQGISMEWVTQTAKPVPSNWAPSEEADHIVYTDSAATWFSQLQFQAKQHGSGWIVLYGKVDNNALQRIKTLGIQVTNMSEGKVEMNWDDILSGALDMIASSKWNPGIQQYTGSEAVFSRK